MPKRFDLFGRRWLTCAALGLLLAPSLAVAQRPTIFFLGQPAETWGQLAGAARDLQVAQRDLKAFEDSVKTARHEFFRSLAEPGQRPAAEARFGKALHDKDIYHLRRAVLRAGQDQAGRQSVSGFRGSTVILDAMLGPEIDGGIAPDARSAFDRWAQGFIGSIGDLRTVDHARVEQAFAKNSSLYDDYKRLRDQAEFDAHQQRKALGDGYAAVKAQIDAARLPDGSLKLAGERVIRFEQSHVNWQRLSPAARAQVEAMVSDGRASGQSLLSCQYGPNHAEAHGATWRLVNQSKPVIWYRQVPPQFSAIKGQVGDHVFAISSLRGGAALANCPPDSGRFEQELKAALAAAPKPAPYIPAVKRQAAVGVMAPQTQNSAAAVKAATERCQRLAKGVDSYRERHAAAPPHLAAGAEVQLRRVEALYVQQCGG